MTNLSYKYDTNSILLVMTDNCIILNKLLHETNQSVALYTAFLRTKSSGGALGVILRPVIAGSLVLIGLVTYIIRRRRRQVLIPVQDTEPPGQGPGTPV